MNRNPVAGILCLALVCCMAAPSVAAEPKDSKALPTAAAKQQVLDLGKEWVAAEVKHDASTLRRILDDKFVASFGAQKPYDKEGFIKQIMSGDVDPSESQTLTDETVVIDQDTGSRSWHRHVARDRERRGVHRDLQIHGDLCPSPRTMESVSRASGPSAASKIAATLGNGSILSVVATQNRRNVSWN